MIYLANGKKAVNAFLQQHGSLGCNHAHELLVVIVPQPPKRGNNLTLAVPTSQKELDHFLSLRGKVRWVKVDSVNKNPELNNVDILALVEASKEWNY